MGRIRSAADGTIIRMDRRRVYERQVWDEDINQDRPLSVFIVVDCTGI